MKLLKSMIEKSKSTPIRIGNIDQLDKKVQPYVLDIEQIGLYVFASQLLSRNSLVYIIQTIMEKYKGNLSETESVKKEVAKFLTSRSKTPNYKQITSESTHCFIYGPDGNIQVNHAGLKIIQRFSEKQRNEEYTSKGMMIVEQALFKGISPPTVISPALMKCYGYKQSKKAQSPRDEDRAPNRRYMMACMVCKNARCPQVKFQICKGCKPSAGCYVQKYCEKCRKGY